MALSTTQYGYIIDPMVPFTDDKGKTIKNGFVRVFVAGSSTPVVTYRNFDGATNQVLIELDNSGRTRTSVIGSKGLTYKVCVYDAFHSQESPILTVDKVSAIGANITAGAGATLVTGLNGLTTKPDGFVDASVVGTDGYVAIDHTLVTDDLDTDAKVTAVEDDRYVPLLNEDVNDPDSKMTLGRLWQWVLGKIKSLSTTITAFRSGDVIPVDGPSGTAKMSKDSLLQETANNALGSIHNLATTATEADLVAGKFLAIDDQGVGGATKKLPAEIIGDKLVTLVDRGQISVATLNSSYPKAFYMYHMTDGGTLTAGSVDVVEGSCVYWNATLQKFIKVNPDFAYKITQDNIVLSLADAISTLTNYKAGSVVEDCGKLKLILFDHTAGSFVEQEIVDVNVGGLVELSRGAGVGIGSLTDNKFLNSSGVVNTATPQTNGYIQLTDYVQIKDGMFYVYNSVIGGFYSAFYNASKTLISTFQLKAGINRIDVPSGAVYARFSVWHHTAVDDNTFSLYLPAQNVGEGYIAKQYEGANLYKQGKVVAFGGTLKEALVDIAENSAYNENEWDDISVSDAIEGRVPSCVVVHPWFDEGHFINSSGTVQTSSITQDGKRFDMTQLIPVSEELTYDYFHDKGTTPRCGFYDEEETFISAFVIDQGKRNKLPTIPTGAKFVRFSVLYLLAEDSTSLVVRVPQRHKNNFIFANEKICINGDSIETNNDGTWPKFLRNEYNFARVTNIAVSGTTVRNQINSQERIDQIPLDTTVILCGGGTNDWGQAVTMGSMNDLEDASHFYGAVHLLIKRIHERVPDAKIVIMSNPFGSCPNRWSSSHDNSLGVYNNADLPVYAYGKAMKEVSEFDSTAFADVYNTCSINLYNYKDYMLEQVNSQGYTVYVHPNNAGARLMLNVIGKKLVDLISSKINLV